MRRIVFQEKSLIIQTNKSPLGWIPLWDVEIVAFKVSDIPDNIIKTFSDDQQDSIFWFFEDIEKEWQTKGK